MICIKGLMQANFQILQQLYPVEEVEDDSKTIQSGKIHNIFSTLLIKP
jgi:hypothetical protein